MKIFPLIVLALVSVFSFSSSSFAATESYVVMEANSARVLLAHNAKEKRPVADLAKIASAKVALDWAKRSKTSLSTMISVPNSVMMFRGANPMNLQPGDQISIRDAIYSSMLGADHTAMFTLSEYIGKDLLMRRKMRGEPQKAFVGEMNQLSKALGMHRTRFTSVDGLDVGFRKDYSTAADVARLCVYALRDTGFMFYVKQKSRLVSVLRSGGNKHSYKVANTNSLLGKMGVNGIKTGMSAAAGQCLAINSHRSPLVKKLADGRAQIRRRDLVVVLMGSQDRFGRAQQLIQQGWAAHEQWGQAGYPVSNKKPDYIVVPQL